MSRSMVTVIVLLIFFTNICGQKKMSIYKSWDGLPRSFFCRSILCRFGYTHIVCKYYNKELGKSCPSDVAVVDFTPELIEIILSKHNEKRDFIASGARTQHLAACRMATMKWDATLASYAELWAMQCKHKHDSCHNTHDFHYSGQNMAITTYQGSPDYATLLKNTIEVWYSGVQKSDCRLIKKYKSQKNSPTTGYFTTMVNQKNKAVGCGAVTYSNSTSEGTNVMLMFCNYAYANMVGHSVYRACPKAATKCKSGTNPKFPHLCNEKEKINVKTWH